ncbi:hypothetical protein KKC45_03695 [Patescibacteria group bacterium]|nr:hypothetical protein [Patescibacteria group bacterium]
MPRTDSGPEKEYFCGSCKEWHNRKKSVEERKKMEERSKLSNDDSWLSLLCKRKTSKK